jgi:hypothetical protein
MDRKLRGMIQESQTAENSFVKVIKFGAAFLALVKHI